MLLALDTAGVNRTTVALLGPGGAAHGRSVAVSPAECLVPLTQELLREAGADMAAVSSIAVGVGPGPYTGLRIGLAHAHALAHALAVPLIGVSSLAAVAATLDPGPARFVVATDARRKEVFSALVLDDVLQMETVAVGPAQDVARDHPGVPVIGDGGQRYRDVFDAAGCAQVQPTVDEAAALAAVAARAFADGGLPPFPAYLREPDAVAAPGFKPVMP